MEQIIVNTHLDGFVLIDEISAIDEKNIKGTKHFSGFPASLAIESLAQLGALHVRFITGLEKHCFLLKINDYKTLEIQELNGPYQLEGSLLGKSKQAFSYSLKATKEGKISLEGRFTFAAIEYDERFKKELLKRHYKKILSCLKNDLKDNYHSNDRRISTEIRSQ